MTSINVSHYTVMVSGGGEEWNVTIEGGDSEANITELQSGAKYTIRVVTVSADGQVSFPSVAVVAMTQSPGTLRYCLKQQRGIFT